MTCVVLLLQSLMQVFDAGIRENSQLRPLSDSDDRPNEPKAWVHCAGLEMDRKGF
jgi:hypothetical protein